MIGFVTTKVKAQEANEAVDQAQVSRGLPVFWLPGMYEIFSGPYDGLFFIPCDGETMSTPLIGNPPLTPIDFPEFQQIVDDLGGLESRVTIDPQDLIDPDAPQEP